MESQIKCPACSAWVSKSQSRCTACGSTLDRNQFQKEERIKAGTYPEKKERKKTRIELWLERTESSENTLVVFARSIVKVVWLMYLGVLSFIIWMVTLLAG